MKATLGSIVAGLIRKLEKGKLEICPLCGVEVASVALHYFTCPKVTENEEASDQKRRA